MLPTKRRTALMLEFIASTPQAEKTCNKTILHDENFWKTIK